MNSKELNKKIREICDKDEFEIQGGKCIPYIGWFWRDVDFDSDGCSIGIVIPGELKGFIENNKWGYQEFWIKGENWIQLKKLLELAVTNPSRESTKKIWDFMQELEGEDLKGGK